ncbi:ATP-binding protein [Roseibium hamelinense]|uniref:ATP-binding protein n=1 Tax=Roseibium hamelinense TaxID=150831 RepID=UPI001FCB12A5|nr:ATP-binding protein [Roseibium hamelinense]
MNSELKTFMELSQKPVLTQFIDDKRAAWLWSADGARILWANAAGAQFFSVGHAKDLSGLTTLQRSPARPHIARIAESGPTEKMSIDRLRFYRGLRVMLLTCQCQRVLIEGGEDAALIISTDKGLSLLDDPVKAFAGLLALPGFSSAVLDEDRKVLSANGSLQSAVLAQGALAENAAGTAEIDGQPHDILLATLPNLQSIALITDEPSQETDEPETGYGVEKTDTPASTSGWMRADELETLESDEMLLPVPPLAPSPAADAPADSNAEEELNDAGAKPDAAPALDPNDTWSALDDEVLEAKASETPSSFTEGAEASAPKPELNEISEQTTNRTGDFAFSPRKRPVRFAWKMDLEQRFTFMSDEFADTLGPSSADIVGQTWRDVAARFHLDTTGDIASALDRRDTWSGKTVLWPVTGKDIFVPVDMAALPAFDRDRKFEGYRGFGVCRTAEAVRSKDGEPLLALVGSEEDDLQPPAIDPDETPLLPNTASATAGTDQLPDTPGAAEPEISEVETQYEETFETGAEEDGPKSTQADIDTIAKDIETGPLNQPDDLKDAEVTSTELSAKEEPGDAAEEPTSVTSDQSADIEKILHDLPDRKVKPVKDLSIGASASALLGSLTGRDFVKQSPALEPSAEPESRSNAGAPVSFQQQAEKTPDDTETNYRAKDGPTDGLSNQLPKTVSSDALGKHQAEPEQEPERIVDPLTEDLFSDKLQTSAENDSDLTDIPVSSTGIGSDTDFRPSDIEAAVKSLSKAFNENQSRKSDTATEAPETISPERTAHLKLENMSDQHAEVTQHSPTQFSPDQLDKDVPARADTGPLIDDGGADEPTSKEAGIDDLADAPLPILEGAIEDTDARSGDDQGVRSPIDAGPAFADAELAAFNEEIAGNDAPRPDLLPVDTSALSRPELAVFRKIAEALGARFEGDLSVFEAPGNDDFNEDLLLPRPKKEEVPVDPSLLDRLPIGIAIANERDIRYANETFLTMLGYKDFAELTEAGGLEAVFPDDDEDDWPDASGMEGTIDGLRKVRLAGGGMRPVDARMHSVPWNGGRALMVSILDRPAKTLAAAQVSTHDPEELERAQTQISEMDAILETATDGVLVLDKSGTIVKVNRSAEALFSANRADMVGVPLTQYLAQESHRAAADYLDGLSRNGVASVLNDGREVLGQVSGGGVIPLFMTMGRVSAGGDPKFCAVLHDITHWKTAEEELTEAKRQAENASSQKSDFLAKISHEIRTPLNAIIGFSEVMMEERFGQIGNDRYKEYLKDIRTSGSHIMSLINDLLDLSKIEAGKLDLRFAAVSANEVISECVALMQPQANRERIIIRASLPDTVPSVVADPRSMRQIILNLLSNAIKFNKAGGQVIVSTASGDDGEVILRVRDTGSGMSDKELVAAMEPFRQLHTSRHGGGTGLGLPLTKALVEANRANFRIDSTPEQGTLVEISFPSQRVLSE